MSKEHIGQYLKKQLDKKGISQTELVKLLGVSRQTINKHINKGTKFKLDNYIKLSEILDIPIDNLVFGGKGRPTELKKFAHRPIDRIDVNKVPKQPDGLGNTLLDYVIQMDSLPKFKLFYEKKCYIEPLHNHIDLICFLIKHNQHEFMQGYLKSFYLDPIKKEKKSITGEIEFPTIDFTQGPNNEFFERNNIQYEKLSNSEKRFIDAIFSTKSTKILDLLAYKNKGTRDVKFPHIFYMAIERDAPLVFKYYIEKNGGKYNQEYFNWAIMNNSTKLAKLIFEKMELKSLENLRKIKDTKYKKEWKEKLNY